MWFLDLRPDKLQRVNHLQLVPTIGEDLHHRGDLQGESSGHQENNQEENRHHQEAALGD